MDEKWFNGLGARMDRDARCWTGRWMLIALGIAILLLFWAATSAPDSIVGQLYGALGEIGTR